MVAMVIWLRMEKNVADAEKNNLEKIDEKKKDLKNIHKLIKAIHKNLTPDLLKGRWKTQKHPLDGHCYVAAEALYHLLNKKEWQPYYAAYNDKIGKATHWWLVNKKTGKIADPTKEQYYPDNPPYDFGKKAGFLTLLPSKRASIVIERIKNITEN